MGICEPVIRVECEKCGDAEEFDLTLLAGGHSWDDRNLKRKMERNGWTRSETGIYCANCSPQ